ncbi:MAG: hypothetical protein UU51_C0035G0002 [Microgenomates group bacterium GW2011_GWC1_41_20]|nr:MAG: hypothetical protein UU51_C0035G0002 [Microgenomates group bacterium GW2011_GWC1_41_20]
MNGELLEIKSLFKKLASASVWCQSHQQTEQSQLLIESYCEALERLGVWRQFAEAVFVFGINSEVAYRAWRG